jgi:DNA ligase-1
MLAVTWNQGKHAALLQKHPYLMSTKWDGVRATWDGKQMKTRGGDQIYAPREFLEKLPATALEGELLIDRTKFNEVSGIVRRKNPDPADWRPIRFMVFDDPSSRAPFAETLLSLQERLPACAGAAKVCVIPQRPVKSAEQVQKAVREEIERGGEGVMLRRADVPYKKGRSATLIKVKGADDAEAIVVGYQEGRNRLQGTLGALRCRWQKGFRGTEFTVGSGLTDAMRRDYKKRFPLGTVVTVDYMSLGREGKPRHPRLKGIRTDL